MPITLIAKNQTAEDIAIADLGAIVIPASGQLNLTDVFKVGTIRSSKSLKDLIDSGNVIINDGSKDLTKNDSAIVVQESEPNSMFFGRGYNYKAKDVEGTTTSGTYVEYDSLSTSSLSDGTYRIGFSILWAGDAINKYVDIRVQLDDATTLSDLYIYPPIANLDVQKLSFSGCYHGHLTDGTHRVDVDYRNSASGTSKIWFSRLELWRIS